MKPRHKQFFSSLKQVEKRLKLDDGNPPPPPPPPLPQPQSETQLSESFNSSPIYFHNQHTNTASTLHDNSIEQPPQEFLSINESQSNPNQNPPQLNKPENNCSENGAVGGIESMIQLLRLSDFDGKVPEMPDVADDEFYDKIVKVKGPKSRKEVERLDNWIKYLLNNGGREPLRLAHLLLAKAAVVSVGGDGDGLEFPSTVDEFLQNDPPSD
ncbi:hypothetical protein L1987_12262 [Smallanthus sonchifolius]|uniref:Uncharacterized protein n=1 Tax=Smallanthus sonchifolius TaxID=185202 RepID=A0ACB9JFD8_9ASTR|nr:hypothetical protein L1987_12262 [Smallanthus sonchifolius]